MSENTETAILAGGCFWPAQELLRHRDGVIATRVGYTGGRTTTRPRATIQVTRRRSRLSSILGGPPTGTSWSFLPDPPARPRRRGCRQRLPLRDLLHQRRAARGRRGHDRRRLGLLGRQGRDQDQRSRSLLGARGRGSGVPPPSIVESMMMSFMPEPSGCAGARGSAQLVIAAYETGLIQPS